MKCLDGFIFITECGSICTDSAYSGVLQQCDVSAVLHWGDAVGHLKGKTDSVHSCIDSTYMRPLECCFNNVLSCVKISWVMQVTMGTSSTETLSVAGNIFVGQVIIHFMLSFTLRKKAVPFQKVPICTL